jgi:hypothetical protein
MKKNEYYHAIDQLAKQRQKEERVEEAIQRYADEIRLAFYGYSEPGLST